MPALFGPLFRCPRGCLINAAARIERRKGRSRRRKSGTIVHVYLVQPPPLVPFAQSTLPSKLGRQHLSNLHTHSLPKKRPKKPSLDMVGRLHIPDTIAITVQYSRR